MKRNIILGSLVALLVATVLWAQTPGFSYGNSWKKVEQLAEKQLPESALKEVENIIRQARKEKNTVQLVKATLYKMRFTLQNDPDKAPGLIGDFEAFTEEMNDPTDKALLYSMTADLYAQHYQSNLWNINHRTEITGTIPEDIKEWTKNIYFDKISGLLDASLAHTPLLQKTNVLKYGELLEKGADSRKLQPTLFDLLASRKIEILSSINQATNIKNPLLENGYFADAARFVQLKPDSAYANSIENKIIVTYRQILSYQMKVNNIPALISADLERLNYFHSNIGNSDSLYVGALNSLKAKFSNNENVVEVLAELAAHYQGKREDRESDEENDSLSDKYNRLAYDICADGIKRFPNYKRINVLYNIQQQITQKELNISYSNETPLVSNLKVRVESKNLGKLQLTVYRVNATAMQYHDFQAKYSNERTYYPDRTLIENRLVSVKCDPDFGTTQTDVSIKPQAYGIYDFYLEEPGNKLPEKRTKGSFVVTDLGYIIRSTKAKKADVYVLNRLSGLPQPDVRVKVYSPKWNGKGYDDTYLGLFTTNSQGLATFGYDQNYYSADLYFENGKDSYFSSRSTPHYSERNSMENQDLKVSLLTDRSVYRPGQTVYFKAIAYRADKEKQTVEANTRLEVELYDANSQKVASKSLTTNEFGSVSGAFVLPEGGLNGAFSIRTTNAYQTFWVEEYKRPTFEVKLEKPAAEIRFGEKASLNGSVEAYAGYGVGSTKVKYRIVRTVHHFCWWYSEPEQEIANDTTVTDGNGNFELSFVPAKPKPTGSKYSDRAYTYTVYCDATDPKGETQHGEQYVSVGDKSLFIITEIPTEINKNNIPSIEISTQTINDQVVNSTIQYSVSRLKETEAYNEKLDESKDLQVAAEVLSGKFETANKKLPLNELKNFESGRYRIVLTATDSHGKEVKLEKTFILYASSDKRPPVKSYVWFQTPKTNCAVGENAQVQFSTSTQNSMVLYEIMQGNTVLESRWIPFSDEIKTFDIPFTEQFGAGVTVMFTFMKDEQLFTRTVQLTRRINLKKLSPTVSVFRDKLQPGEKAEWTVSIPESANGKAAELMVGMYDASLDVLYPHNWNFYPVYNEQVLNSPVWRANDFESTGSSAFFNVNLKTVNDLSFDQINWFGLELGGYYERRRFRMSGLKFTAPVIKNDEELSSQEELSSAKVFSIADVKGNDLVNAKDITQALQGKIAGLEIVTSKQQPEVKPRTNFNETAFFYPQLRTDDKGNVKFTFTAPESLTRWNVKMLAHTQDLYFGQFDTTAITQKDFMVQMNLPRFVRRSDELVLSASVINLTDQAQQATVQFEMIDPATNKVICTKTSHLSLGRGAGGEVHWELTEFAPYDLVICKVVARAGNFSDGEQKYLPVLPDKVLVTESLPLTIRGNQKRAFTFESLLKNGGKVDNKSLTVEFSSNPAWYAVQALPTLSTPESD
ncbi:MAG TPA: alpha-2-macroglobulin family protein, partial [Paludibacter sp.]|nr:alpha-2-macroglobulin family protein [Paludibacter sp.]